MSAHNKPMTPIKVLLVDDNAMMLQQVKELLATAPWLEIVGEATDGLGVITKARELQPQLVLMDVGLPGQTGLEATRQLKDEMPQLKVIILTLYDMPIYRETALANGAGDYIIKKTMRKELLPAIQRLMQAEHPPTLIFQ